MSSLVEARAQSSYTRKKVNGSHRVSNSAYRKDPADYAQIKLLMQMPVCGVFKSSTRCGWHWSFGLAFAAGNHDLRSLHDPVRQ